MMMKSIFLYTSTKLIIVVTWTYGANKTCIFWRYITGRFLSKSTTFNNHRMITLTLYYLYIHMLWSVYDHLSTSPSFSPSMRAFPNHMNHFKVTKICISLSKVLFQEPRLRQKCNIRIFQQVLYFINRPTKFPSNFSNIPNNTFNALIRVINKVNIFYHFFHFFL